MTNFKEKSVKKQKNGKFCYLKQEKNWDNSTIPKKGTSKKVVIFRYVLL